MLEEKFDEGEAKGRTEGIIQVARNMKTANKPITEIIAMTGLSAEEINDLS